MSCLKHFPKILVAAAALTLGAGAADTPAEADAKTRALEERVKTLEKRVAELEGRTTEPGVPRRLNRQRGAIDEMMQRMQRDMLEHGNIDPQRFFGDDFGAMVPAESKPRLGVMLDKVSDELKTQFKNEVKEGAFVMSVVPNSAAQKAGIAVGDAITDFDGKAVATPAALIDAVKAAVPGSHELTVIRRGEALALKVELGKEETAGLEPNDGWMRRGNMGNMTGTTRTDIKVSSLEMTDSLAKDLKLNDEQRKKMDQVLGKHAKALSDEFTRDFASKSRRGGLGFSMNGDLNALAKKHGDDAAKELAGVLSDEQLKKWNEHRATNSNISFSQVIEQRGAPGNVPFERNDEPKGFSF